MHRFSKMAYRILALLFFPLVALAARQPYDVRKIIQAFKEPHSDLTLLCAHRGLRWNGTAENSREAIFRASKAGPEFVKTDINISADGQLPVIHHGGLGRTTDIGDLTGHDAYNPFTGRGYNPVVKYMNFTGPGGIEKLHLRDEQGRVKDEHVSTLPQMVVCIGGASIDVVLILDFKVEEAVEPTYWALKTLTNKAVVLANECCIYKLESTCCQTPEEFEALPWVQDAFRSGVQLAFVPVYDPRNANKFDQLASMKQFAATNYTISAMINLKSVGGPVQSLLDETKSIHSALKTAGTFFAPGDFTYPNTAGL
ncbi:hypothetical protein Q7P35_009916 [Cladosporium inversicolor]